MGECDRRRHKKYGAESRRKINGKKNKSKKERRFKKIQSTSW
jgi:hypothetical protein